MFDVSIRWNMENSIVLYLNVSDTAVQYCRSSISRKYKLILHLRMDILHFPFLSLMLFLVFTYLYRHPYLYFVDRDRLWTLHSQLQRIICETKIHLSQYSLLLESNILKYVIKWIYLLYPYYIMKVYYYLWLLTDHSLNVL